MILYTLLYLRELFFHLLHNFVHVYQATGTGIKPRAGQEAQTKFVCHKLKNEYQGCFEGGSADVSVFFREGGDRSAFRWDSTSPRNRLDYLLIERPRPRRGWSA